MDRCTARNVLCATVHQRMAWTDVGSVGVVRRLDLGESVAFSQISSHGGVSQVRIVSVYVLIHLAVIFFAVCASRSSDIAASLFILCYLIRVLD